MVIHSFSRGRIVAGLDCNQNHSMAGDGVWKELTNAQAGPAHVAQQVSDALNEINQNVVAGRRYDLSVKFDVGGDHTIQVIPSETGLHRLQPAPHQLDLARVGPERGPGRRLNLDDFTQFKQFLESRPVAKQVGQ